MHCRAVTMEFAEYCELLALCDSNPGRLRFSQEQVAQTTGLQVVGYGAEDFDRILSEQHPAGVIVTTKDR